MKPRFIVCDCPTTGHRFDLVWDNGSERVEYLLAAIRSDLRSLDDARVYLRVSAAEGRDVVISTRLGNGDRFVRLPAAEVVVTRHVPPSFPAGAAR